MPGKDKEDKPGMARVFAMAVPAALRLDVATQLVHLAGATTPATYNVFGRYTDGEGTFCGSARATSAAEAVAALFRNEAGVEFTPYSIIVAEILAITCGPWVEESLPRSRPTTEEIADIERKEC